MGFNKNEGFINKDNLHIFAYTSVDIVKSDIKAIILDFHGLGHTGFMSEPTHFAKQLAELGGVTIFPYYGPWAWMNFTAINFVDDVVAAFLDKYNLPETTPIISSGGSMGGCSALAYTRYARITPVACAVNCPVCDLPFHCTERDDLPRTMYNAFGSYECGLQKAMELHSPLHLAPQMPDIPYMFAHGTIDPAVNKASHSDKMVAAMKNTGHSVEYLEVEGMGHCNLGDFPESADTYNDFIKGFIK